MSPCVTVCVCSVSLCVSGFFVCVCVSRCLSLFISSSPFHLFLSQFLSFSLSAFPYCSLYHLFISSSLILLFLFLCISVFLSLCFSLILLFSYSVFLFFCVCRDDYVFCTLTLLFHALCSNLLAILWLLWAKDHFRLWRLGTFWVTDVKRFVWGRQGKRVEGRIGYGGER